MPILLLFEREKTWDKKRVSSKHAKNSSGDDKYSVPQWNGRSGVLGSLSVLQDLFQLASMPHLRTICVQQAHTTS